MATDLAQGDSLTYAALGLTITWQAPVDTGCLPIVDYKIQATLDPAGLTAWTDLTTGIAGLTGTAADPIPLGGATAHIVPG